MAALLGDAARTAASAQEPAPAEADPMQTGDSVILRTLADVLAPLNVIEPQSVIQIGLFVGLVTFATVTSLLYVRERNRWARRSNEYASEIDTLRRQVDRTELLMGADRQVLIAWSRTDENPAIEGDVVRLLGLPNARRVLALGSWLPPLEAAALDKAIEALRSRGDPFCLVQRTLSGGHVEIEGRAVAGRALARIRDVGAQRSEVLRLTEEADRTRARIGALEAVLNAMPHPAWLRDTQGCLAWVNTAYVAAVEAESIDAVVERRVELIDKRQRTAIDAALSIKPVHRTQLSAVVAGMQVPLDVIEVSSPLGRGGLAYDLSAEAKARSDLERQGRAHAALLDRLTTAVAIFDSSQRLAFYNQAYRQLWALDDGFLSGCPTDSEILDQLRVERRLPEQADYRSWRASRLALYASNETRDDWWYLPDARTIRVVTSPHPQGGLISLFDDVTERFSLESQVNVLTRMQGETLDFLREGVAVFGSDGRLKLANPALATLWKLPANIPKLAPHVSDLVQMMGLQASDDSFWSRLTGAVTGLESRDAMTGRLGQRDGTVLECALAPLPDGGTLVTFADITAKVGVERALTERNEALEKTERLRDEFVHHVSYALRSPLTTITGFTHLLAEGGAGALNERQREYAGLIQQSSNALLAIIDDILDLASIDRDSLELDLADVDIAATIDAVSTALHDRLADSAVRLAVTIEDGLSPIEADPKRVRQILFNLVSNAIGASSRGSSVAIDVSRAGGMLRLAVTDHGAGIDPDRRAKIFERFESDAKGGSQRGLGLGLSIVRSFVELHGGSVSVDSTPGEGTTFVCLLPATRCAGTTVDQTRTDDRPDAAVLSHVA